MAKQTIKRIGDNPSLESVIPTPTHANLFQGYWSSPEALASFVETLNGGANNWSKSAWENDERFTGTKDMAQAIEFCRNGWPEGAERAARLRDKINAANPTGPRVVRWDVAGSVASVPRYLSGNPLNMRRVDTTRLKRKPVLTLLSDMSANCTIGSQAISNRAAVVAAVIDAIEDKGFACEVITFEHGQQGKLGQITGVTVKESGAPADIGRLAFALGHASFFRRLTWAGFTCDAFTKPLGMSLGHSARLDTTRANELGAYILPTAEMNQDAFRSEDNAATKGLRFLIEALRKQDCPAFPLAESDAA